MANLESPNFVNTIKKICLLDLKSLLDKQRKQISELD